MKTVHLLDTDGKAACGAADGYTTPNDSKFILTCNDCKQLAAAVRADRQRLERERKER